MKIDAASARLAQADKLPELLTGLRIDDYPDGDDVLVVSMEPNSP